MCKDVIVPVHCWTVLHVSIIHVDVKSWLSVRGHPSNVSRSCQPLRRLLRNTANREGSSASEADCC